MFDITMQDLQVAAAVILLAAFIYLRAQRGLFDFPVGPGSPRERRH